MSVAGQPDSQSLSAEIRRVMAQGLAAQHIEKQERLRTFGDATLWMAAIPFATASVARIAGVEHFEPLVSELQEQGLVERSLPPYLKDHAREQTVYTMTAAGRAAILGKYLTEWAEEGRVRGVIANYCRRLSEPSSRARVPPPIARWAELGAFADDSERLTSEFDNRVRRAFIAGDAAALLHWIDAARPLDDLLQRDADDALSSALKRASRQQELLARVVHDEQLLRDFLERPEQSQAFRDLVHGPDDTWALHLFGVGGVGKTMALRHLAGALARDQRDLNAYTARIDFDYLNPDYPRLDPGLLLWSFGQELRKFDSDNRAAEFFDKADEKLLLLRQRLTSADSRTARRPTADPRFIDAVVHFIGALQALDRRVILIVDTCEELSKIRPDGTVPENVQETFRILEALHDGPSVLLEGGGSISTGEGVRSLRVVFAGRRPLARSGPGWRCHTSANPEHKSYLRLHELRGFTEPDAARYLREKAAVPTEYIETIVEKTPDVGAPAVIEWDDTSQAPSNVARCNPYDLKFFADWVNEDPRPSLHDVAAVTNANYVQVRILRRLEKFEPLRRIMPLVALVKHVGEGLLYELLPGDKATADQLFERLRQQEWIDQRTVSSFDGKTTRTILTVEEGLRRRLWSHFALHEPPSQEQLTIARNHLEQITLTRDLGALEWPVFDASLRLMDSDPVRGTAWWKRVERRIIRQRGPEWMIDLAGTLIAEKNVAEPVDASRVARGEHENALRAPVLASYAAALRLSGQQSTTLSTSWEEVLRLSERYIVQDERPLLRHRARCGRLAAIARRTSRPDSVLAYADTVVRNPLFESDDPDDAITAAAAAVSAADALVELTEVMRRAPEHPELVSRLTMRSGPVALAEHLRTQRDTWVQKRPDEAKSIDALVAFAEMTAARALTMVGKFSEAADLFSRAMKTAAETAAGFPEWMPPARLDARIRLELARNLCPAWLTPADALTLTGLPTEVIAHSLDLDVDRYFSIAIGLAAAITPTPDIRKLRSAGSPGQMVATSVTRAAHGTVRPFYATLERELAWLGFVDDAVHSLRAAPVAASTDFTIQAHLERVLGEIVLRMRLSDEGEKLGDTLLDSLPGDRGLLWAISSYSGDETSLPPAPPPASSPALPDLAWLHAAWQAIVAVTAEECRIALAWVRDHFPAVDDLKNDFDHESISLDIHEAALMLPLAGGADVLKLRPFDPMQFSAHHPHEPIESLKLLFRCNALAEAGASLPNARLTMSGRDELVGRVGARYAARIALAEGDVAGLRLPTAARHLFSEATALFVASKDPVGEFLARARLALVSARDANAASPREALDAYARLVSARTDLSLPPGLSNDAPLAVDQAPKHWRPWLHRLEVIHAYEHGSTAPAPTASYWQLTGGRRLPPDVRRIVVPATSAATEAAPARGKSKAREWIENTFFFLLGLAIIAFGFYWTFAAFRWATRPMLGNETSNTSFVILYIGFVILLSVFGPKGGRAVLSRVAAKSNATIVIEPVEETTVGEDALESYQSRALELPVQMVVAVERARIRLVPPGVRYTPQGPPGAVRATSGGLASYEEAAKSFTEAVEPLRAIVANLGSRTMCVKLACDEGVAEPAWEALLQLASIESGRQLPVLRCRRVHLRNRPAAYVPATAPLVITAAGDAATETLLKRAWESAEQGGLQVIASGQDVTRNAANQDALVVHLFGRIEETVEGLAFQTARRDSRRQSNLALTRPLTASVLAKAFPRATLFIVQPSLGSRVREGRGTAEREDAMLARRYGSELFHEDIPAVLVLPRLEAAGAAVVAALVGRTVGRRSRMGTLALEDLVVHIQRQLAKSDSSDSMIETMLDTCLFCVDSWDGSLERGRASRGDLAES